MFLIEFINLLNIDIVVYYIELDNNVSLNIQSF